MRVANVERWRSRRAAGDLGRRRRLQEQEDGGDKPWNVRDWCVALRGVGAVWRLQDRDHTRRGHGAPRPLLDRDQRRQPCAGARATSRTRKAPPRCTPHLVRTSRPHGACSRSRDLRAQGPFTRFLYLGLPLVGGDSATSYDDAMAVAKQEFVLVACLPSEASCDFSPASPSISI